MNFYELWADLALSDRISIAALLISIGALWVAWHFGRPQRELARVHLAKEKAEELQAKSAMILCRLTGGSPALYRLYFSNAGKADARNVSVDLKGDPDCERLFGVEVKHFPIKRIRPHGNFSILAQVFLEAPERYRFNVSWDDDSGTRKTEEQLISRHGD